MNSGNFSTQFTGYSSSGNNGSWWRKNRLLMRSCHFLPTKWNPWNVGMGNKRLYCRWGLNEISTEPVTVFEGCVWPCNWMIKKKALVSFSQTGVCHLISDCRLGLRSLYMHYKMSWKLLHTWCTVPTASHFPMYFACHFSFRVIGWVGDFNLSHSEWICI
jgi:hypothetical protein